MSLETLDKLDFKREGNSGQPLYEQIRKHILQEIKANTLKQGEALPRITSLSQRWNVNYRTLKTAFELLEKDGVISWEPNKGGVVNAPPKTTSASVSKTTMAFIRIQNDAFYAAITDGLSNFAGKHDVELQIIDTNWSHERTINAITHQGKDVQGLLMVVPELPAYKKAIQEAVGKGLKVVLLDRTLDGLDVSSVTDDHFMGAYTATKKMIELHNRPVYHFRRTDNPSSLREWHRGWLAAMVEYNFLNHNKYIFMQSKTEAEELTCIESAMQHDVENAGRFFDTHKEDVYCIFAGNDYSALGVCKAAKDRSLEIGGDVFVVSFGDMPFASRLPVPLASVKQNLTQVGYEGARLLYETLNGSLPHPISLSIPVELQIRASMLPPNVLSDNSFTGIKRK